jgi:sensor c-di-GMP phosphodiesterase-like protein
MRHRFAFLIAIVIAVCAGVLPLATVALLSRQWAFESERTALSDYARTTLDRAKATIGQAEATLAILNAEAWDGCYPEHLLRMRQLTIDDRFVEEIGYYSDGRLACTGWGPVDKFVAEESPDYTLSTGTGLHFDIRPEVTDAGTVLVVSSGRHNALIKPERFVDVLFPGKMTVGVATDAGRVFALSGRLDTQVAGRLLTAESADPDLLVETASEGDFKAFAVSSASAVPGWLDQGRWVLVPIGLLASSMLVGLVAFLSRRRLSLKSDIQHGLRSGEFIVHYQPLIELATGRCAGAEALVRWRRPNGTLIPPDVFIPYCEQDDLILELTASVIRRVIADLASELSKGGDIHVAINVSARDMEDGGFLDVIAAETGKVGVDPSRIWIEATERGFIRIDAARATLERARSAGHAIAIDDFGTGYSSLSMLEGLPLDALKIDKSFVDAIGKGAASSIVTPHVIEMAHGLKLDIVAEGIETQEQEAYLRLAGVQYGQGWRYSKALPPELFVAFYREHSTIEPPIARRVA